MRYERAFYATTLGMILIGAYALGLGAPRSIFPILTVGVCVLNWVWYFRPQKKYLPDGPASILCALVFLITMMRASVPGGYGVLYVNVPLAGELLLVVQWILLFRKKAARDYAWIYVCSAMLVVSGLLLTPEMRVVSIFIMFGLLALCAMSLLHLRAESEKAGLKSFAALPKIGGGFFTRRLYFGAALLVPTVMIFIATPRLRPRYLPTAVAEMQSGSGPVAVTGFSDTVELGDMGTILESPEKVMEVKVTLPDGSRGGEGYELLMRGRSFARYDGSSWRGTPETASQMPRELMGMYDDDFGWYARDDAEEGEYLQLEVWLEPLNTRVLFTPFAPVEIDVSGRSDLRYFQVTDSIGFRHPRTRPVSYETVSRIDEPENRNPPDYAMNMEPDSEFYSLPNVFSPAVQELAYQIVPAGEDITPLEGARRIERHLQTNYAYSLDVPYTGGAEPIEHFLFEGRVGYCEHYASAMVALLRMRGIPARLVTGFKGGEWNSVGKYFTLRQMDAHSWVEAYVQPYGWVTFDPTGFSEGQRQDRDGRLGTIGDLFTYLQYAWVRYVIAYDRPTQDWFFSGIRDGLNYMFTGMRSLVSGKDPEADVAPDEEAPELDIERGRIFAIAMIGISAVIITLLTMYLRGNRRESSLRFYDTMLRFFRKRGLPRKAGTTPMEFAVKAAEKYPQLAPTVHELTDEFCRIRYGGVNPDPREQERLLKTARNLGRIG